MTIIEATDKSAWNQFVIKNASPSPFQQSWEWGEFQTACGNKVYRLEIPGKLAAQIIVKKLPLGKTYLEIPRGPVAASSLLPSPISGEGQESWDEFVKKLREIAKKEKAVLARFSPPYPAIEFKNSDIQRPEILTRQIEPQQTILVDLSKNSDEIMTKMHEKSRYNIRLATRKGVTVRDATEDAKAFERFLELLKETSERDKITLWPESRFKKFAEFFLKNSQEDESPRAILLVGELEGKILAGAQVMLFGDAGTYLYAGSTRADSTANAPSLVLWEAIKAAQNAGKHWYDMWGVAPSDEPEHSWAGITRFKSRYIKTGETGKELKYAGTFDYIFDKKIYALFKLGKKILGK